MKRVCKKCKNMIVMHAFSEGNCISCGKKISTEHIPCDKLCKECSEDTNSCACCAEKLINE